MHRLLATALLVLLAVLALPASPALADCAPDERPLGEHVEESKHVWKATVVRLDDDGRVAVVEIEEVWKGEAAPERVRVLPDSDVETSSDRTWVADGTYLLFPRKEEDGEWHDDSCSPTRVWEDTFAELRPAGSGTAATGGAEDPPESGRQDLLLAAVVVGALALAGVAIGRRRR